MEAILVNLRQEWKTYAVALSIVVIMVFLMSLTLRMNGLISRMEKVESTLGSVEGVVNGSDFLLKNQEATLNKIKSDISVMNNHVKRLR